MSTYPMPQDDAALKKEEQVLEGQVAHEGQHEAHEETATGLDNKKVAMWLFLASECMLFGALLGAYLIYAGQSLVGPYPADLFDMVLTTIFTFVLLMSSLAVALAVQAASKGDQAGVKRWLLATVILGISFLGFQFYEYSHFMHEGLFLSTNLFGTTFYLLTGFHGVHVAIGVTWLFSLWLTALRGDTKRANATNVEIAGLYWHFVDIVWIVIFGVVYLMAGA